MNKEEVLDAFELIDKTDRERRIRCLVKLDPKGPKEFRVSDAGIFWTGYEGLGDLDGHTENSDYFTDLNAIQRIIGQMPEAWLGEYDAQLWLICSGKNKNKHKATAAEKCESVLKARKEW